MKDLNEAHIQGVNLSSLVDQLRAEAVPVADVLSEQSDSRNSRLSEVERLRLENHILRLENRALRNPHIKQEAAVLIETLKEADRLTKKGRVGPEGWCIIRYDRLADRLKLNKNTIARHISKGVEHKLLDKKNWSERKEVVDRETGEVKYQTFTTATFRMSMSLADHLASLANFVPGKDAKRNWGGKRVSCPRHPDATVIKGEFCSECGELLRVTEVDDEGHAEQLYPEKMGIPKL